MYGVPRIQHARSLVPLYELRGLLFMWVVPSLTQNAGLGGGMEDGESESRGMQEAGGPVI